MKSKSHQAVLKAFQQLIRLPLTFANGGFTLIEILVTVLIIGILAAVAVPQYQRALLKSRYAGLMPIAKSMADSNEVYYLEHGNYADNAQDLPVQGRHSYPDDTALEFGTVSDYAYVMAKNENKIPNNTFVVYQKHSGEFPGEVHCEALANNDLAESVCKSFGGNASIGKTLTDGYETYVLFGTGDGVAPTEDEGDEGGDNNGGNSGTQTPTMSAEELQAFADAHCKYEVPYHKGCVGVLNNDGTISVCENYNGTVDEETGECVTNGTTTGKYETVYNTDGTPKKTYGCSSLTSSGVCKGEDIYDYNVDGSYTNKRRVCLNQVEVSKDGICPDGKYSSPATSDIAYDSHGNAVEQFTCYRVNEQGICSGYGRMLIHERSYPNELETTGTGYVQKLCVHKLDDTTCDNYKPLEAFRYPDKTSSAYYTKVVCYNFTEKKVGVYLNADGSCESGYSWAQYSSNTSKYKACTNASIDWEMATCS